MAGASCVLGSGEGTGRHQDQLEEARPRSLGFVSLSKRKLLKSFKTFCVAYNSSKTNHFEPSYCDPGLLVLVAV